MNQLNAKILKKTIAGAGLLATTPVWAKSGQGVPEGGKSQSGINTLSLEESPGQNVILCASNDDISTKTGNNITPNDMTVAVNPFDYSYFEVVFTVRDILAKDQDHVLFLVYSPRTSPSPQIPTPTSLNKLELDMAALEILAIYNIPAQQMMLQGSTRMGAANPAPRSAVSFAVNFDTAVLPTFIRDNEQIHLQAAFMKKSDYDAGAFDRLILSELDTIGFVEMSCPDGDGSIGMDQDGTLTTTSTTGNTTKTQETSSNATSSTSVTKGSAGTTTTESTPTGGGGGSGK